MDPYFNNGLYAAPTSPPTPALAGGLPEGAAGLDPYSCYANTPPRVPELHAPLGAPQQGLDGLEKLDDVSTWNLDTIRRVAASLAQDVSQNPALFDTQDQWAPSPPFAAGTGGAWHDEEEEEEGEEEEEAWGACGGVSGGHAPLLAAPCSGPEGAGGRSRKLKMYEWPPQSDPKLEKRRLRAVRQRQQRLREEELENSLRQQLKAREDEVASLSGEVQRRNQHLLMLQRLLAQRRANVQPRMGF